MIRTVPARILPVARLLAALAMLASCAAAAEDPTGALTLFEASDFAADDWRHVRFVNETRYAPDSLHGEAVIRASPARSSSLLLRALTLDIERCPRLEWRWAVRRLQPDADIRQRSKEDVGAALLLLFGDPLSSFSLREAPMLRYVWTNSRVTEESVVDSPFMPGVVRSIVVRSGAGAAGELVTEGRDVAEDFRKAFGREPPPAVHAIGIFADNDQTGQPGGAYFAWARAFCSR